MHAGSAAKIEKNIDLVAATLFAAACGYATHGWLAETAVPPALAIESAVAIVLAFLLSSRVLIAVRPEPRRLPVSIFDVRDVGPIEEPELLLTHVFEPSPTDYGDALVLDDILAKLSSDSRVVRLFDPAAMPTASELKSRIDRHLDGEASAAQTTDATQALHEALAELRRAIR
jgi:hypothetical protein